MPYVTLINFIFGSLFAVAGLLASHFIFFAIVGVFAKKKFPHTEKKLKYGIIIPTRNETKVVGNLIDSIRKNRYPQDKLDIFVIAHNCEDDTADVARAKGAKVYEYNNPNECTKGYALKHLFERIEEDYGTASYDGFFILDADNILAVDYIDKMNDAFVAYDQKGVITSFRNSKNFGKNIVSAMYGLYFLYGCRLEARGRSVLGCSTRVSGTGFLFNSATVKNGWNYLTLTEDWEFTADKLLENTKIYYCDEAMFYDEQPTSFKVMWTQRIRWAKGHLLVFQTRFLKLLKSLFTSSKRGGTKYKASTYDILVNITPVGIVGTGLALMQILALCFSPLFGYNLWDVILGYLSGYGISFLTTILTLICTSIILCMLEIKRLPRLNPITMLIAIILWPVFVLLAAPFDVIALFSKNLVWKAIPHDDTTDFDEIHGVLDNVSTEEAIEVSESVEVSADVLDEIKE